VLAGCHGRIHHHSWLPDGAVRSAVVLLHGYGEHLGLYDVLARRLVADGHAVHAMDAVGHGRSDGDRALIASWDGFVDDALRLAAMVRRSIRGCRSSSWGTPVARRRRCCSRWGSPDTAQALVLSGAPLRPLEWIEAELALGTAETVAVDPSELMSTKPFAHASGFASISTGVASRTCTTASNHCARQPPSSRTAGS
jgi:acylglycerol lipase